MPSTMHKSFYSLILPTSLQSLSNSITGFFSSVHTEITKPGANVSSEDIQRGLGYLGAWLSHGGAERGGGERRLVAGPEVVLNHLDTLDGPSPSNAQPKLGLLSRCSQLPHTVFSCGLAICHLVSCMHGLKLFMKPLPC